MGKHREVTKTSGRSEANVILRYETEVVGQQLIDKVCKAYNAGLQISDIVRMVKGPMNTVTSLNLADVYYILYHAVTYKNYTSVEVKQRLRFKEFEISLKLFPAVLDAWRKGVKKKDIYAIANPIAVDRICHSLYCRANGQKAQLRQISEGSAIELLSTAKREVINGEDCLVISMNLIPDELYKRCFPATQESSVLTDEQVEELNNIKLKDHGEVLPLTSSQRVLELKDRKDGSQFLTDSVEPEYKDETEDDILDDLPDDSSISVSDDSCHPLTDSEKRQKLEELFG